MLFKVYSRLVYNWSEYRSKTKWWSECETAMLRVHLNSKPFDEQTNPHDLNSSLFRSPLYFYPRIILSSGHLDIDYDMNDVLLHWRTFNVYPNFLNILVISSDVPQKLMYMWGGLYIWFMENELSCTYIEWKSYLVYIKKVHRLEKLYFYFSTLKTNFQQTPKVRLTHSPQLSSQLINYKLK